MSSPKTGKFTLDYELDGNPISVELLEKTVLGRADDCQVVIPSQISGVSRRHAMITQEGTEWYVSDNGSTNGTYVNRVRITKQRLRDGDIVNVGPLEMTFHGGADQEQIDYEDDAPVPKGSIFISMGDVDRILASMAVGSLGGHGSAMQRVSPLGTAGNEASGDHRDFSWAIRLFTQIGESLLSTMELGSMLENIMSLVFANIPAERGVICNYDEETGRITPKTFRSLGANSRQKLRVSRNVINEAIRARSSILVADADTDARFQDAESVRALRIKSAMCSPLIHDSKVKGIIYVDTQSRLQPFREEHLEILTALSLFSGVALEQARLREDVLREQQIRNRLAQHHSPAVVDQMIRRLAEGKNQDEMLAEERIVTVLFTDLSGFTARSEKLLPTEVIRMLNGVFERLSAAVFEFDGTLDKFMGDGMMAFYGAPLEYADHAQRAVYSAMRMQQALDEYNKMNPPAPGATLISMRIGINTGPVVVGDVGSRQAQRNYTVIGDTVNTASRLESSVAKAGQIVVGPATYAMLQSQKSPIQFQALEPKLVKGKEHPVQTYLVTSTIPPEADSMGNTSANNRTN